MILGVKELSRIFKPVTLKVQKDVPGIDLCISNCMYNLTNLSTICFCFAVYQPALFSLILPLLIIHHKNSNICLDYNKGKIHIFF